MQISHLKLEYFHKGQKNLSLFDLIMHRATFLLLRTPHKILQRLPFFKFNYGMHAFRNLSHNISVLVVGCHNLWSIQSANFIL